MQNQYSKTYHQILSVVFIVILVVPVITMVFGLEETITNNENRQFEKAPKVDFKNPMGTVINYRTYFNESFGGKTTLVNSYIRFKRGILNDTPIPNSVVEGDPDWFFLGNYYNNILHDAFGNFPFEKNELERMTDYLEDIKTYLDSKDIKFYVVIPPDKHTMYIEKLPYSLKDRETRLDIFKSHVKAELDFEIIDLYDPLNEKKSEELLYISSDSHWNDYGAYIGYETFMSTYVEDFPNITMEPIDAYTISKVKTNEESISARMINLNPEVDIIKFNRKEDTSVIRDPESSNNFLHFTNPSRKGKIIMHRDSFANAWIQFFNDTFEETYYLRRFTLDKALIEKVKPDAVIFEMVERNINVFLPD